MHFVLNINIIIFILSSAKLQILLQQSPWGDEWSQMNQILVRNDALLMI